MSGCYGNGAAGIPGIAEVADAIERLEGSRAKRHREPDFVEWRREYRRTPEGMRACAWCGDPFPFRRSTAAYCCDEHRVYAWRERKRLAAREVQP